MINTLCRLFSTGVFVGSALAVCHASAEDSTHDAPPPQTLAEHKGIWVQPALGLAVNIQSQSVRVYSYTRETCLPQLITDSLEDADKYLHSIQAGDGTTEMSLIYPEGLASERLYLERQDALPQVCQVATEMGKFDPKRTFDHIWHVLNDFYPAFEGRDVDWQQAYAINKAKVTADTSQAELFSLIENMLVPFNDNSLNLMVNNAVLAGASTAGAAQGWDATVQLLGTKKGEYGSIIQQFNQQLQELYGEAAFKTLEPKKGQPLLAWGRLKGNVGYLQVNGMAGFSGVDDGHTCTESELSAVDGAMDQVLQDFAGVNATIIDVRFNGGGDDAVALAIANRFAEQKQLVYTRHKYTRAGDNDIVEAYVTPHDGSRSSGSVVLITGPNTAGAAEIFGAAMKAQANVAHIGEATAALVADAQTVELFKGWKLTLPYEVYRGADGAYMDAAVPDATVPVTSFNGVSNGILPAVTDALLQLGVDLTVSEEAFNTLAAEIMASGPLPGFATAWIDGNKVLGTHAKGYANLAEQIEVTQGTPFSLASISKTFTAVAIAQAMERDLISLDTRVAELPMGLTVDSPMMTGSDITLRHLVTHTSGIADSDNYSCSYYIEENDASLANAYGFPGCPEPVETNQLSFLTSYLQEGGLLYSAEDNFLPVQAGEMRSYSNIGAALAAEMLPAATGIDLETWTEQSVFAPLQMHSTHWFSHRFPADIEPATRYLIIDGQQEPLPEYALATWADGGVKSSAADMANYLLAIARKGEVAGRRILAEESVDNMLSAQTPHASAYGDQGIFWRNDGFIFGHNGSDPGVTTKMFFDQHNSLGFILLINASDLDDDRVLEDKIQKLIRLVYHRGLTIKRQSDAL